jgi:hypothetical protein
VIQYQLQIHQLLRPIFQLRLMEHFLNPADQRDHMAVEKQLRQIQQITSEYSKAKESSEYKKILLTEVAIYVKIGR